ncbi:MAG: hypothetical protein JWP12_1862 [Bacteroidetes bacterium]|nr:hypothetical protein [Bacteroidota bacterium]
MKKLLLLLSVCSCCELSAQTLTNAQVYDYMPGDIFQYTYTDYYDMGMPCYFPWIASYYTDSVTSKHYSAVGDTVFYTFSYTKFTPSDCSPTPLNAHSSGTFSEYHTDLSSPATHYSTWSCAVVDTFYTSSTYCGKNVWDNHSIYTGDSCFEEPLWSSLLIEGCGSYISYHGGYGGEPHYSNVLTYYKKGGVACGTPTMLGIKEETIQADIHLYPNPSNGMMNFNYFITGASVGELAIYDLAGKEIIHYKLEAGTGKNLKIDETMLCNGIYFYKMIVNKEVKASDKMVIIK